MISIHKYLFDRETKIASPHYTKNITENLLQKHMHRANVLSDKFHTTGCIYTLQLNHNGTVVASSNPENGLRINSTETGAVLYNLRGHREIVTALEWMYSPNENMFLSSSLDRTIILWKDYKVCSVWKDHADWIRALSLSKDNQYLLSGDVASSVCIWDVERAKIIHRINADEASRENLNSINSLAFSNTNSNLFLTASRDGIVRMYDMRDINRGSILEVHAHGEPKAPSKLNDVAFLHEDHQFISSGRDSCIRRWDLRSLKNTKLSSIDEALQIRKKCCIVEMNKHLCKSYNINCCIFNNENYLITGSEDYKIYIYDLNDGHLVTTLDSDGDAITHLVHVRDGGAFPLQIAASGLESNKITIWRPTIDSQKKEFVIKKQDPKLMKQRQLMDAIMDKYSDQILKLFHRHNNVSFNGGLDVLFEEILSCLMQENNDQEIENMLNVLQQLAVDISRNVNVFLGDDGELEDLENST